MGGAKDGQTCGRSRECPEGSCELTAGTCIPGNADPRSCESDADCASEDTCVAALPKGCDERDVLETFLSYPFYTFEPGATGKFDMQRTGDRIFDYNFDGLAHVGLYPDMLADVRNLVAKESGAAVYDYLDPLFHSAEAFVRMWEKIEYCTPDDDPPNASCPPAVIASTLGDRTEVEFLPPPTAADEYFCDWWPELTTDVADGAVFDIGVTTVTATATDNTGRSDTCQFDVNVSCFGVNQLEIEQACTGTEGLDLRYVGRAPSRSRWWATTAPPPPARSTPARLP